MNMSTTHRSTTARGATVTAQEAARFLSEHLGRQLLAITIDADPSSVDRWVKGARPQLSAERRILAAYAVWQVVATVEAAATVRAWFMGMNPQLDDLSPAEAIAADNGRDALAAARAFVQGG